MINSSAVGRQDSTSEILELESISPSDRDSIDPTESNPRSDLLSTATIDLPPEPESPRHSPFITQSVTIASTGQQLDIKAELESLLQSIRLTTPHIPDPAKEHESISDGLAKIAAAEPIAHSQQLLAALNHSREQLEKSQTELLSLHQRNQSQIDTVDSSVLQVKQIKFRTQQLARHSQNQLQKVQQTLGSFEQIRQEIITNLARFGGYEEIHSMLVQLEDTRHALVIAHDRLRTGQEAFFESLRAIQEQVTTQSQTSEHKLLQYKESIQILVEAISADRDRIAVMGLDMTLNLAELKGLNTEITTMHGQIVEKSQTLQGSITEIDRGFAELSQSVQKEKEQFYELTAETIDKAEIIRSQFTDIARQIGLDREAIEQLKTEVESVRYNASLEAEHQLNHFDRQYNELMSTWSEMQVRQKNLSRHTGRFWTWLWVLSFAVGVIFILLITVLTSIR
jgi:hypothetical protein